MTVLAGPAQTYLDCLQRRDLTEAMEVAEAMLDAGSGIDGAMAVLADAQRVVGTRWASNEWSVAQEHAATAITDRVAGVIAAAIREPVIYPPVVVVCGEGDWHTLSARMFADLLRARQWDARFLGGSIPGRDLRQYLADEPPVALVVSCAIPMFLPGACETVAAAHAARIPVLAGGGAFGVDGRRAAAIGADAWAASPDGAAATLRDWTEAAPELARADDARLAQHRNLRADRLPVVEDAEDELRRRLPYMREADERQRARTREDLEFLLAFVEAAVLTNDASIVAEYLPWLRDVLTTRGVPAKVLVPTVEATAAALRGQDQVDPALLLEDCARNLFEDMAS